MWVDPKIEIEPKLVTALDSGWKNGVGEGWHVLLYRFARNVDYLVSKGEMPEVQFSQIKEKFGGLRIYFSGGNDLTELLASVMEDLSYSMCGECGRLPDGDANQGGWFRTRCAEHS